MTLSNWLTKGIGGRFGAGLASLLFFGVTWQVLSMSRAIDPNFFPAPTQIATRFAQLLAKDTSFLLDIWASVYRLLLGTLISAPIAVALGVCVAMNRHVAFLLQPLIAVTYPIPKLAIFPLLLVIFGVGDGAKVAIIAIGVFFLVLLNTIQGVENLIETGFFDIIHVYRIPFFKRMSRVILRGALPDLLNGLKMGMGYGLVMVVAGEFTISDKGIGTFMWNAWDHFKIVDLYCGLAVISFLGIAIFLVIDLLRSRLKGEL